MRPAGTHCHRGLAHCPDWLGLARCSVPLEGQQSASYRGNGCGRPDRLSAAAASLGDGQISELTKVGRGDEPGNGGLHDSEEICCSLRSLDWPLLEEALSASLP